MEVTYLHHLEGVISSEFFESRVTSYREILAVPPIREQWDSVKHAGFSPGFVRYMDDPVVGAHHEV